jgi:tetratricopeptide (TPR) repeat protein
MVLRLLLVLLLLCVASGAVPQAAAPSAIPHESPSGDAFKQARELLAAGSLDQAAALTKRGLTQYPQSVVGLNLLGVIYQQQGKYQKAVAQFQQALEINPNSVDTLVNLGTSLAAQDKNDQAEQSLKKALRLRPGNKTAIYNLGSVLLSQQRPKESLSYLRRIPAPDRSTRLLAIRAYLDADMPADGIVAAEKLSQAFPKDTRIHFSLGLLLASHRQYRQAAFEFEKADALEPRNFDILHDLGHAYLLNGQYAKAQETLTQALRLNPDSADTLYLLAETAAGMHREVDALELLAEVRHGTAGFCDF